MCSSNRSRAAAACAAIVVCVATACDGGIEPPPRASLTIVHGQHDTLRFEPVGAIEITTVTSGYAPDPDGYVVAVDSEPGRAIGVAETLRLDRVMPGEHTVGLVAGISSQCLLTSLNPARVSVIEDSVAHVTFALKCGAPLVRLTLTTTGENQDADGYTATVDRVDVPPVSVASNGTYDWQGLAPGTATLTLRGIAPNCGSSVGATASVTVEQGAIATATFNVDCSSSAERIAFAWKRNNNTDVYTAGLDGRGVARLTTQSGADEAPAWSPDGRQIAFSRNTRLYVMDADGSNAHPVGDSVATTGLATDWSRDGQLIAFSAQRRIYPGAALPSQGAVDVIRPDGTGYKRLVYLSCPDACAVLQIAFSPDGSRITYGAQETPSPWLDYIRSAMTATGVATMPRTGPQYFFAPRYSPDGSHLLLDVGAATYGTLGPSGLIAARTDTVLTQDVLRAGTPVDGEGSGDWTPDGRRIVFSAASSGPAIYWTPFGGTGRTLVLDTPGGSSHVRVRP